MRRIALLLGASLVVVATIYLALLVRRNSPSPLPAGAAPAGQATWRGYDSGYASPATNKSEDANARRR